MNAETKIWAGAGVGVFRFWHPDHDEHVDPRQERSEITSLNFLDSGQFSLKIGRDEWDMDHSQCFITRPGLVFRSKHRQAFPRDVFFSVQFDESIVDEALLIAGKPHARTVAPVPNRAQYLLLRLKKHLEDADTLAPEVLARELLTETLTGSSRYQYSVQQVRWYTSRIDEARSILETTFSRQHSLTQIARSVGMAPYHFAHIFAELAGMPPHRYLLRIRLQAAARLLREGIGVTTTCFEVGFNHLSHFSRMFRREFGCSPSRFRILKAPPYS